MLVSKGSITHVSANPYIISGLLERGLGGSRYPCPNLRAMTTGGGPIKKNLVRRFYECLPHATLTHLYGLSEATSVVAGGILSPDETAVNVGKFVDSVEMKVTDDQELWLRGDSLMLGYLNENPWPRDEWFPTGDLVEIDEVGNLSITGRKKNIVVRAGRNVNPVEIEAALAEHQGCEDSFVFGVDSEEDRGEDLVAFVVSRDKSLRPEDFISSLRDRLSSYKVPSELYIVDKIERTPMRKVIKESVLREYSMLKRKSGE